MVKSFFSPASSRSSSSAAPRASSFDPTPRQGGYTLGVKNGQRPLRPYTSRSFFVMLGAALLVPATAFAQPAGDPGLAKLKATADKAVAEAQKKAGKPADKPKAEKADGKAEKTPPPEERALRGVVQIERAGQVLGLGAVLAGDGRVLTALSPLGHGNDLDARLADNSLVRVKLGHHDRGWDLALLVPQTGKWGEGLTASSDDPVRPDAAIHAYTLKSGKVVPASLVLRSHKTLVGGDDKALDNAIELGSRISPADLGSPLIDESGRVVAVLGRGCAPAEGKPCTPVAFGVPIAAIKSFLRSVPATAVAPPAWLGIQGLSDTGPVAKGVRVLVVHPESPAEEAHLKGGDKTVSDVILAVGGVPVTSPEQLAEVIRTHGVGEKVPLLLFGQGQYHEVTVMLRAAPEAKPPAPPPAHPAELPPLPADK
jgi:serine protease Do